MFLSFFFFFNDTATTEIYTLSLHDALPIVVADGEPQHLHGVRGVPRRHPRAQHRPRLLAAAAGDWAVLPSVAALLHRSEEHTSELQSRLHLVCRLLLEKKKHTNVSCHTKQ